MDTFSLTQCIFEPTRITNKCCSTIDLCFVSVPTLSASSSVLPPLGTSDHSVVSVVLTFNSSQNIKYPRKSHLVWCYKRADFVTANNMLFDIEWEQLLDHDDINLSWNNWKSTFMKIMSLCIPRVKRRSLSLPWVSKSILDEIKKRNSLYHRCRKSHSQYDWILYKRQRNHTLKLFHNAKLAYYNHLGDSTPKTFWSTIHSLNKSNYQSIPSLYHGDASAVTNVEKAQLLNEYFVSCFNTSTGSLQPSAHDVDTIDDSFLCTYHELVDLLLSLDCSKSPGPDGITGQMLKKHSLVYCFISLFVIQ